MNRRNALESCGLVSEANYHETVFLDSKKGHPLNKQSSRIEPLIFLSVLVPLFEEETTRHDSDPERVCIE